MMASNDWKRAAATKIIDYWKARRPVRSIKHDEAIAGSIPWRPSLHFRANSELMAFEISDVLEPAALIAAEGRLINHTDLVAAYVVCPLELVQKDRDERAVKGLVDLGFGLITVNQAGEINVRNEAIPLAQFISLQQLDDLTEGLPAKFRRLLKEAHAQYSIAPRQGLQKVGQIVEAAIRRLHEIGKKRSWKLNSSVSASAADLVDDLYSCPQASFIRAQLGAARIFLQSYRNAMSHPSKTAAEAQKKATKCRRGFEQGCELLRDMLTRLKSNSIRITIIEE